MDLMFITNDSKIAKIAENAGIEIIFIDLEKNGKHERQGHLDTHIADHHMEDVLDIKNALDKTKVLVRINPYFEGTRTEVDQCIEYGADIIMLPMFKTKDEVEKFIEFVDGRAEVCLLLETPQALVRINEIVKLEGIDRIHVGLNDLHLGMGLDFMFELLSEGIVEYLGKIITNNGIKFGFGGIAKCGEGAIPAELIIKEHYRLSSEMVILSRTFRNFTSNIDEGLKIEIEKIRSVENEVQKLTYSELQNNKIQVQNLIRKFANDRISGGVNV